MFSIKLMLICVWCIASVTNGHTTYFIEPCKAEDHACKVAFQEVHSELLKLGKGSFDPMTMDEVEIKADGLHLILREITVENAAKCQLVNVERDDKNKKLKVDAKCPLDISGKYNASGKLGFLPVEGDSHFNIKTDNIMVLTINDLEFTEGKHKITNKEVNFETIDKVFMKFHDLFKGDAAKAKPVEAIIDAEWATLVKSLGNPVIEKGVKKLIDNINIYLEKSHK